MRAGESSMAEAMWLACHLSFPQIRRSEALREERKGFRSLQSELQVMEQELGCCESQSTGASPSKPRSQVLRHWSMTQKQISSSGRTPGSRRQGKQKTEGSEERLEQDLNLRLRRDVIRLVQ